MTIDTEEESELDPVVPRKRRILQEIVISDISAVDMPAQEFARMAIMKRADDPANDRSSLIELEDRVLTLQDKVDAAFVKFNSDQPRDGNGKWTVSGGSSDGDTSAATWAGRIATVAGIASLAIPAFAGLRAAKILFDGTHAVLSTPAARKKLVREVVGAMAEKANSTTAVAAGALSTVLGLLADKREAEISKADNSDPILEQLRAIQATLAALITESDEAEIEKELTNMDFNELVETIRKRDNCSGTEALRKARQRSPEAFADYNAAPLARPNDDQVQNRNSAAAEFESAVDACVIAKRLTRIAAMREIRKRRPDLFAAYQEG